MIDSTFFFFLTALGYFFGFVLYLLHLVRTPSPATQVVAGQGDGSAALAGKGISMPSGSIWGTWATRVTLVAFLAATTGVVLRVIELWQVSGFFLPLPVTNSYETFAFFSWVIPLAYLIMERRFQTKSLGAFAIGLSFLFVALASSPLVADKGAVPMVPALQSYWLVAHVIFTIVGEGFFAVAFVASLVFLGMSWSGKDAAAMSKFEDIAYRATIVGFPFFTLGALIFGMVWAQHAWGRYWGWDPKEVWSLITWLVFALYLHARVTWGWRDRKTALLIVIGFLSALFTWFGVNYVLSGLHSYS